MTTLSRSTWDARLADIAHFEPGEPLVMNVTLCASWVARSELNVPVIGRETFDVARGIAVLCRHAYRGEYEQEAYNQIDQDPCNV